MLRSGEEHGPVRRLAPVGEPVRRVRVQQLVDRRHVIQVLSRHQRVTLQAAVRQRLPEQFGSCGVPVVELRGDGDPQIWPGSLGGPAGHLGRGIRFVRQWLRHVCSLIRMDGMRTATWAGVEPGPRRGCFCAKWSRMESACFAIREMIVSTTSLSAEGGRRHPRCRARSPAGALRVDQLSLKAAWSPRLRVGHDGRHERCTRRSPRAAALPPAPLNVLREPRAGVACRAAPKTPSPLDL